MVFREERRLNCGGLSSVRVLYIKIELKNPVPFMKTLAEELIKKSSGGCNGHYPFSIKKRLPRPIVFEDFIILFSKGLN